MLSVFMECRDQEQALAMSLATLVPGAVEGLIREVVLLDQGSRDGSVRVADAAGCRLLENVDLREAVASARSDWLFVIEPGARPLVGWIEAIGNHIAAGTLAARLSPSPSHRPGVFRRWVKTSSPIAYGLVITRRQALANARQGQPLASLGRGIATRRLAAQIVPASAMQAAQAAQAAAASASSEGSSGS